MMYPTASEDATEEVLHWEPVDDMEFDDDFNFTFPKGSSLLSEAISKRANKLKLKAVSVRHTLNYASKQAVSQQTPVDSCECVKAHCTERAAKH